MEMAVVERETASESQQSRIPPQLAPFLYQLGHPPAKHPDGRNVGRPLGSKTETVYVRAETKLAKKAVEIALNDRHREQGATLRQAIDKFLPDAGKELSSQSSGPQVVIFLGDPAHAAPR